MTVKTKPEGRSPPGIYSEEIVEFLEDIKAPLSVGFAIEEISLLVDQHLNLSYAEKEKILEQKIKELDDIQQRLEKSKNF